jgi:hypothetical protein
MDLQGTQVKLSGVNWNESGAEGHPCWPSSARNTFMVANGLAEILGWRRQRLAEARQSLIELGYLQQMRQGNQYTGPALYRWRATGRSLAQEEEGVS